MGIQSLVGLLPPVQVIGLCIDVVGTFVIAAPDIPFVNIRLRGGKLRSGRAKMEAGELMKGQPGYYEILKNLSVLYGVEINEYPDLLRVEAPTVGVGEKSKKKIFAYYSLGEDGDEIESEEFCPAPYGALRLRFREEIRKEESKIRWVGFLILAFGFVIQILGILLH